ncbi:MAG: FKBP-type peptidyl-prolyl cis-trans isomerase [Gammaproteobacteria bacterium]|jgi:FKBP-type peptidyl-prolyl cis-trans isomerase SlpA
MKAKIDMHSLLLMHYSIALTSGTEIESSFDDEPVEIGMGSGVLTEGMELALYGLQAGDKQTLTLTPEQGFGLRDEENIHMMPLSEFPDDLKPESGLVFEFETAGGEDILGTILSVKNDQAEVDFNHPLAGQPLVFTVEILEINNASANITNQ